MTDYLKIFDSVDDETIRNNEKSHVDNPAPRDETLKELADKVLARNKKQMQAAHPALRTRISKACEGLPITPAQYLTILNDEDKQAIINGEFEPRTLRAYARAFSEGIESGRILFHPSTGALMRHGIKHE